MPAIVREPAKVTFDQLDAHDGELIPERTVLSGVGMPGAQGITGGNPLTSLVGSLIPVGGL